MRTPITLEIPRYDEPFSRHTFKYLLSTYLVSLSQVSWYLACLACYKLQLASQIPRYLAALGSFGHAERRKYLYRCPVSIKLMTH